MKNNLKRLTQTILAIPILSCAGPRENYTEPAPITDMQSTELRSTSAHNISQPYPYCNRDYVMGLMHCDKLPKKNAQETCIASNFNLFYQCKQTQPPTPPYCNNIYLQDLLVCQKSKSENQVQLCADISFNIFEQCKKSNIVVPPFCELTYNKDTKVCNKSISKQHQQTCLDTSLMLYKTCQSK